MIQRLLKTYTNRFVSKWFILAIDAFIIGFSYVVACILRFNFDVSQINDVFFTVYFPLLIGTRIIAIVAFGSYKGIIRHTSTEDVVLIFKAIGIGTIAVLVFSSGLSYLSNTSILIPISILVIESVITLVLLTTSRFLVKALYEELTYGFRPISNVIVYGAGHLGLLTKNTLLKDKNNRYKIIAFVDDNLSKINKTIEGVRVYSPQEAVERFFQQRNSLEVILAVDNLTPQRKLKITDLCLYHGIVLKTTPPVQYWINGQFSSQQINHIKIEELLEREPIQLSDERINEQIFNKTILITGAAGSIGSEIVRQLLRYKPEKVILLDQAESALYDLEFEIIRNNSYPSPAPAIQIVVANIADEVRMHKVFKQYRPDWVFHAAAYKHVPMMEHNPYEAIRVNVMGTKTVADLAVEFHAEKFVMVSTDKAVNPTNVMGASKRLAEMYTQSLNKHSDSYTKFITTRFGNVLGSNGSVIPLFKKQIESGGPVTVTHPEITRYFMTIPEACQLVLEAGTMGKGGEIFVFDMGESVKIIDLAKKMIQLSGLVIDKDIKIVFSGLRPGEKLYEELLSHNEDTQPTYHSKIMIARVAVPAHIEMRRAIYELQHLIEEASDEELVQRIKLLVPEFISNNSIYTLLDK